jgi:hypothetical protein
VTAGRDVAPRIEVLDAGMRRGDLSVEGVELLPEVLHPACRGWRGEDQRAVGARRLVGCGFEIVAVLRDHGVAGERLSRVGEHARHEAVATEGEEHDIRDPRRQLVPQDAQEVTRCGARERVDGDADAHLPGDPVDVGAGLDGERITEDGHAFLRPVRSGRLCRRGAAANRPDGDHARHDHAHRGNRHRPDRPADGSRSHQGIVDPPLGRMMLPVQNLAASEAR